jgi:hypothetical protein
MWTSQEEMKIRIVILVSRMDVCQARTEVTQEEQKTTQEMKSKIGVLVSSMDSDLPR